jgi:hypothetical protein
MNGFLKPSSVLLQRPLKAERGAIVLEPGFVPRLEEMRIATVTVASEHFAHRAKARA